MRCSGDRVSVWGLWRSQASPVSQCPLWAAQGMSPLVLTPGGVLSTGLGQKLPRDGLDCHPGAGGLIPPWVLGDKDGVTSGPEAEGQAEPLQGGRKRAVCPGTRVQTAGGQWDRHRMHGAGDRQEWTEAKQRGIGHGGSGKSTLNSVLSSWQSPSPRERVALFSGLPPVALPALSHPLTGYVASELGSGSCCGPRAVLSNSVRVSSFPARASIRFSRARWELLSPSCRSHRVMCIWGKGGGQRRAGSTPQQAEPALTGLEDCA
jgi:hypothetical protein